MYLAFFIVVFAKWSRTRFFDHKDQFRRTRIDIIFAAMETFKKFTIIYNNVALDIQIESLLRKGISCAGLHEEIERENEPISGIT